MSGLLWYDSTGKHARELSVSLFLSLDLDLNTQMDIRECRVLSGRPAPWCRAIFRLNCGGIGLGNVVKCRNAPME